MIFATTGDTIMHASYDFQHIYVYKFVHFHPIELFILGVNYIGKTFQWTLKWGPLLDTLQTEDIPIT